MKIGSSTIAMLANHSKDDTRSVTENIRVWVDPPAQRTAMDTVQLSQQYQSLIEDKNTNLDSLDAEKVIQDDPKLLIIKKLIETLTGKTIALCKSPVANECPQSVTADETSNTTEQSNRVGWGVRYEYHETYSEKEQTSFAAGGIIKTADGQEIQFTVNLSMSREFIQSTDFSFRAGDALLDPLVINFNGNVAELTDQKFAFDLNADGVNENMPFVAGGSGILVFDRNGDQIVNNGSELFGPQTGNGFQELAALDQTNDGWIDENDGSFSQLYVWTKDGNGNNYLRGLKESGVGAIYTPAAETSFDLKNSENETEGRIQQTSIYISENGQAGTIQQIDVAV
jgi:hypothetical protein